MKTVTITLVQYGINLITNKNALYQKTIRKTITQITQTNKKGNGLNSHTLEKKLSI
jgi:hypothetical protein